MDQPGLRPSSRIVEADWLAARLAPFGSGVASVVPGGFPAYVRILHPACSVEGEALRWADVAARSGRTMHRLVQFHAINPPAVSVSEGTVIAPELGSLPPDLLRVLCTLLAQHTSTPDSCWFCLWEGYGWLHDSSASTVEFNPAGALVAPESTCAGGTHSWVSPILNAAVLDAPRLHLPNRDYLLFEGPLERASDFGWNMPGGRFVIQSPNLFWPNDHAWCVASEIDLVCTLVGGSDAMVKTLLGDPRLEGYRVFAEDPIAADSDEENR